MICFKISIGSNLMKQSQSFCLPLTIQLWALNRFIWRQLCALSSVVGNFQWKSSAKTSYQLRTTFRWFWVPIPEIKAIPISWNSSDTSSVPIYFCSSDLFISYKKSDSCGIIALKWHLFTWIFIYFRLICLSFSTKSRI